MRRYKSRIRCFYLYRYSSMDGRPRPGLPSGKDCCKQSDPEQFGCPSVRRLLDVYGELETPSTLCTPTPSSFVSPCGLCDNSEQSSSLPDSLTLNSSSDFVLAVRWKLTGIWYRIRQGRWGINEGERKFIFNLVTTPASGRGVITESFNANLSHDWSHKHSWFKL